MNLQELIEKYGCDVIYELAQSETATELQEKLNTCSELKMELSLEELMATLYPLRGKKMPIEDETLEGIVGGRFPPQLNTTNTNYHGLPLI